MMGNKRLDMHFHSRAVTSAEY